MKKNIKEDGSTLFDFGKELPLVAYSKEFSLEKKARWSKGIKTELECTVVTGHTKGGNGRPSRPIIWVKQGDSHLIHEYWGHGQPNMADLLNRKPKDALFFYHQPHPSDEEAWFELWIRENDNNGEDTTKEGDSGGT